MGFSRTKVLVFLSVLFVLVLACNKSMPEIADLCKSSLLLETKASDVKYDSLCVQDISSFSSSHIVKLNNGIELKWLRDSLYLLEEDMVFSRRNLNMLSNLDTSSNSNIPRSASIITTVPSAYYWPGGVVPYKMSITLSPSYRVTIARALEQISNCTPITFRYFSNDSSITDYIVFNYSSVKNSSFVGRQGGPQEVKIKTNDEGTVIHEVMHALGFFHEHSRADRDHYISINTSNIRPDKMYNFNKYNVGYSGCDLGAFDFNSIMLYSSKTTDTTFVYDTSFPMMTRKSDGGIWWQSDTLSSGDIDGVWVVYGHPPKQLRRDMLSHNVSSDGDIYFESYLENTVLTFYTDNTHTIPQVLSHPARLNLTRSYTHINSSNQVVTDVDVVTIICQPGQSSYTVASRPNYIYLIDGAPYQIDVTHYSL